MPFLAHIAVIAAYGVVAGAAALMLPRPPGGGDPILSYMVGICIFLAAALVHEILSRRHETRDIADDMTEAWQLHADEVDQLRDANTALLDELNEARAQLGELRDRVERSATAHGGGLAAEVRLLQEQLRRFADRTAPRAETGRGSPAPVAAPAALAGGLDDEDVLEITRHALENNRVDLYLQPVVSLPQRKTRFLEAFSRVRAPDGRLLLPERFLPVAAERGLVPTMDNLLLFRCVQLIRGLKKRHLSLGFFINLSAATLADRAFFAQFAEFLEANPALGQRLIFELSQQDLDANWDAVAPGLRRLGELGFQLSLDRVTDVDLDIGRLARLPFRFIKISAAVLLSDGAAADARIHPMDLKRALKRHRIDLIVDKVETEAQVRDLLDFGVDFGQGFLFGEPRPGRAEG